MRSRSREDSYRPNEGTEPVTPRVLTPIFRTGSEGRGSGIFTYLCKLSPHYHLILDLTGGSTPRPGEISLAHNGVLFLDELPEFEKRVLEALREPLESGRITISRAARRAEFPARVQLVAAMNPCPCGYHGHPDGRCRCSPEQIARYHHKLSGPLLDRIDLMLEVPALPASELQAGTPGETSAAVRARVARARAVQLARQGKPNALLAGGEIDHWCTPDAAGARLLAGAIDRLGLSARAYHRILKVARTIADMGGTDTVCAPHVAEAVQSRRGPGTTP
ncbi:MAG: ATP-binding protein [Zoogloea sp.]|nr:ATP-binding protein [Zoogloea sp.]